MIEYDTIWQITGAGIGLVLASMFYAIGGRRGKWHRRFLASFILAVTINVLCATRDIWDPWMLAIWPLLSAAFHLGYGADSLGTKILKRSLYAAAALAPGVLMAFLLGGNALFVLVPHIFIGFSSVWLGVKNPVYAPAEEFLICMVLNLFLLAYPFVV